MSLIRVPEHRPEDLRAWDDVSRGDLAYARTEQHAARVMEAMRELRGFAESANNPHAGVSWGKDSSVLAHLVAELARSGGPVVDMIWFSWPGFDMPHTAKVASAFAKRYPDHPIYRVELEPGPPRYDEAGLSETWCDTVLRDEFARLHVGLDYRSHILGLRGDESARRRRRMRFHGLSTRHTCAPIGRWSARDVWAYLATHDLPIHPVYAMSIGGRLDRDRLRVDFLATPGGREFGRVEWEAAYMPRHKQEEMFDEAQ